MGFSQENNNSDPIKKELAAKFDGFADSVLALKVIKALGERIPASKRMRLFAEVSKIINEARGKVEALMVEAAEQAAEATGQTGETTRQASEAVDQADRVAQTGHADLASRPEQTETTLQAEATLESYNEKIQQLMAMAETLKYEQTKVTRESPWVTTLNFFKHKQDRFFKVLMIAGKSLKGEKGFMQAMIVREHNQYDKHACDKSVGQIILPVRMNNGVLEVGITAKSAPCSFGEIIFIAPRASISNKEGAAKLPKGDVIWDRHERPDAMRMTGKDDCRVVMVAGGKVGEAGGTGGQEDAAKGDQKGQEGGSKGDPKEQVADLIAQSYDSSKIVWFNLNEIKLLVNHPKMEDSATLSLLNWVLANKG